MRASSLIAQVLIVPLFSCTCDPDLEVAEDRAGSELPSDVHERVAREAFEFDIIQRTCAMYFAVRSRAFEGPIEFGREVDDTDLHLNLCPGGTMVACVVVPMANGDSIVTGVPLRH